MVTDSRSKSVIIYFVYKYVPRRAHVSCRRSWSYVVLFITAVSNKLYQLFVHGRWFSPGTPTSTTKTGRHDIAEILLKVALKHQNIIQSKIPNPIFVIGLHELYKVIQQPNSLSHPCPYFGILVIRTMQNEFSARVRLAMTGVRTHNSSGHMH
jgi:hypothetical protein